MLTKPPTLGLFGHSIECNHRQIPEFSPSVKVIIKELWGLERMRPFTSTCLYMIVTIRAIYVGIQRHV